MGYQEGRIVQCEFVIGRDRQDATRDALATFARDLGWEGVLTDVDAGPRLFSVKAVRDGDDNVVSLEFEDRLLLEIDELFSTLASHVESGSYIHWQSGTGAEWRYLFDGQRMVSAPK